MYGLAFGLARILYRVQALTLTQPQDSEIAQTASNEAMPIGHGVTGDDDDDADPAPVGSEPNSVVLSEGAGVGLDARAGVGLDVRAVAAYHHSGVTVVSPQHHSGITMV